METADQTESFECGPKHISDHKPRIRAVLLPIKDLRNAKQRLVGVLTPAERFALAQAMLADTIEAVRGVRRAEKVFVITNYEPAMETAANYGWDILRE
jgi:2-phospho-L-lactate guanylyltransferase (CobY/MobA/RfbA family)